MSSSCIASTSVWIAIGFAISAGCFLLYLLILSFYYYKSEEGKFGPRGYSLTIAAILWVCFGPFGAIIYHFYLKIQVFPEPELCQNQSTRPDPLRIQCRDRHSNRDAAELRPDVVRQSQVPLGLLPRQASASSGFGLPDRLFQEMGPDYSSFEISDDNPPDYDTAVSMSGNLYELFSSDRVTLSTE